MQSGRLTLLSGVTEIGASADTIPATRYRYFTFFIVATGTVSATVTIEAQDASGGWQVISSNALSAVGTTVVQKEGAFQALRANVSVYSSGTFSVHADFAS